MQLLLIKKKSSQRTYLELVKIQFWFKNTVKTELQK